MPIFKTCTVFWVVKGAVNAEGIVQVNKVKERLNKITTKVMGAEKVRDVLLQAVQQRPV